MRDLSERLWDDFWEKQKEFWLELDAQCEATGYYVE
jgi:hypothetical protein